MFIWKGCEDLGLNVYRGVSFKRVRFLFEVHCTLIQVLYWGFKELGMAALGDETHWNVLGVARSHYVKRLPGGMSEYTKMALQLFYSPFDCKNGIRLQIAQQNQCVVIFSEVRIFLGDEAALKELLQFKGASGTRLCPLCSNIIDHKSDLLQHETSGTFLPSTTLDASLVRLETNESVGSVLRFLEGNVGNVSREAFSRMQQFTGWNLTPTGLLLCRELQIQPVDALMWDWMHTYVAGGIFQLEVGLLLEPLRGQGVTQADLHAALKGFSFPRGLASRGITGQNIFEKKQGPDAIKCSASEALSIYSVLRFFLIELRSLGRVDGIGAFIDCYLKMARVLDLLVNLKQGAVKASILQGAILDHLRAFQMAHGLERWLPKHHMAWHLASMYSSHKLLCSCFTHERKHKAIKRYTGQLANTWSAWETSVLTDVLRDHINDVSSASFWALDGLVAASDPSPACKIVLQAALGAVNGVVKVSLDATLSGGIRCSSKDMLLLNLDGRTRVGQAIFFSQVGDSSFAYVELWTSLGRNEFQHTSERVFCDLSCVRDVCTYRTREDRTAVVPNSCW